MNVLLRTSVRRRARRRNAGRLIACWLAAAAPARAAVDYALSVEGLTPSRVFALGFAHAVSNPPPAGAATHAELRVTKPVDRASAPLAAALCHTQRFSRVRVEAIQTTPTSLRYYAVRLKDVLISSYGVACPPGAPDPVESVSLNYQDIEWTFIETDASGVADHAASSGFDLLTGTGGPRDPDSDGDGIPDSYEADERLKPLTDDADEDADDDRMTNLKEFLSGTSASDPTSLFRVTGFTRTLDSGASVCTVTFSSVPGRAYDLYAAAALTDTPTFLGSVTAHADLTSVDLTLPAGQAFVRVSVRVP